MSRRPEGGPSMAAIAEHLEQAAEQYPSWDRRSWPEPDPAEFRFGRLTLRCRPYRESVLAVANKYRRGLARSAVGRRLFKSPKRRPVPRWTEADEAAFQRCCGYPTTYEETHEA